MDITVTTGTKVRVRSPYDPVFTGRARKIGGDWKDGVWEFDLRSEAAARDLCKDVYGTDGSDNDQPRVTVRIPLDNHPGMGEFRPAGESLVWRRSRDESVKLAPHVVLVAGDFPASGGSMRYPDLCPQQGTVIEVRDLAPGAARMILDECDGATVVEPAMAGVNAQLSGLEQERARLVVRLAEIDRALAELSATMPA